MELKRPYLLFIGDARDDLAAKTAYGVAYWRPEWSIGQVRLDGCKTTLGLPDMTVEEGAAKGAKTMVIGVANRGGVIAESWHGPMRQAVELGMDLASGLHNSLGEVPGLADTARRLGRSLVDVRIPDRDFAVGSGVKRTGKRLLTVGTDVSCGKMFTALAIEREMLRRGLKADFRATGQTGILIAGSGVSVDAVIADFISGATEWLSPDNTPDHWDLVEGQGSLFHPSYAGVTLGLVHGAQPDALVLCHEPTRPHKRGIPHQPLPDLKECMDAHVQAARLTNPAAQCVGVSINTSRMPAADADAYLKTTASRLGLPCVDSVKTGVAPIVDRMGDIGLL